MRGGLAVVAGPSGPSSAIPPSTAIRRPAGLERREVVERRAHRDRVGVVAVVDQHGACGQVGPARPAAARRICPAPDGPSRSTIGAERDADRDRAGGVGEVVGLGERELERRLAVRGDDLGAAARRRRARRLADEDVAAGAEGDRLELVGEVRLERLGVGGDHRARRRRRGPARISAFASAIASSVPSSSRWTGPTLVIAATSGSAISQSSAIWPMPAHRHLEHQQLGLGRRGADRQRQPDLGVEVLRARVHAAREQRPGDVLDRGLAGRAGDPDDRAAELAAARRAPARCSARERVGGGEHPARAGSARPSARARARASTTTPQAPAASAAGGVLAAVGPLAAEAEEEVARAGLARVDRRRARDARRRRARATSPPASAAIRSGGELDHARSRRRERRAAPRGRRRGRRTGSCARARTPGPARGPCPRSTTVSPALAPSRSASAIAARRSGSTSIRRAARAHARRGSRR